MDMVKAGVAQALDKIFQITYAPQKLLRHYVSPRFLFFNMFRALRVGLVTLVVVVKYFFYKLSDRYIVFFSTELKLWWSTTSFWMTDYPIHKSPIFTH
jgi:hypothetical protein